MFGLGPAKHKLQNIYNWPYLCAVSVYISSSSNLFLTCITISFKSQSLASVFV